MRFFAIIASLLMLSSQVEAQQGIISPGDVIGNGTSSSRTPTDASLSAVLDQALGATNGFVPMRGASTWTGVPLSPLATTALSGNSGQYINGVGGWSSPSAAALPSATASQVYVGTGASGAAAALSPTSALIAGVTSGSNAAAGYIGEIISASVASGSAVSQPTSGTAVNITSVSLSAGDWDCGASAITNPAGTTTTSLFKAGMSGTSVTLPTPPAGGYAVNSYTSAAGVAQSMSLARTQYNAPGSQTVYLVGNATFATSTMSLYGQINCRRVR